MCLNQKPAKYPTMQYIGNNIICESQLFMFGVGFVVGMAITIILDNRINQ